MSQSDTWAEWARVLALATSVPPMSWLYRKIYLGAAQWAGWRLSQVSGVQSVYLLRSCARGEILPGVSDIDLGVVAPIKHWEEILKVYRTLKRRIPMLDPICIRYLAEEVGQNYRHDLLRHFRFDEGRKVWRLLYGEGILEALPPANPELLRWGQYIETAFWWEVMALGAQSQPRGIWGKIDEKTVCYKALAETLRMRSALQEGSLVFLRREGLDLGTALLDDAGKELVARLQRQANARFLKSDPTLFDDSYAYLLRFLAEWHTIPEALPNAFPVRNAAVCLDAPPEEQALDANALGVLRRLSEIAAQWRGFEAAAAVPALWYGLEDIALVMRVSPEALPSAREVALFLSEAQALRQGVRRNIHLLAQVGGAAFELDEVTPSGGFDAFVIGRNILSPLNAPEACALLTMPERFLMGTPSVFSGRLQWMQFQESHIYHWRHQPLFEGAWRTLRGMVSDWTARRFLANWWKALQLATIQRSAERGEEIILPMTLPAIRRALAREGFPLPQELEWFEAAFYREVAGDASDIDRLRQTAIDFLQTVCDWNAEAP